MRQGWLADVAASSPSDAWAVGGVGVRYDADEDVWFSTRPFILHWAGARWTEVEPPAVKGSLSGVAVAGQDDAWAVGRLDGGRPFVIRWNGRLWRTVALGGGGRAVSVTSRSDVWTVGSGVWRSRGGRWARVAAAPAQLEDVVAISRDEVWAVGGDLAVHWDGRRTRTYRMAYEMRIPGGGRSYGTALHGVAARAADDVWAVGDASIAGTTHSFRPIVMHWNGRQWLNRSPDSLLSYVSVAARASGELWVSATMEDAWIYGYGSKLLRLTPAGWRATDLADGEYIGALARDGGRGLWGVGWTGQGTTPSGLFPGRQVPLVRRYQC